MNRIVFFFKPSFNYFCQILLVVTLACSEPFEFETSESLIDVVDAKVSTLKGESYVNIYSVLNGEQEIHKSNLEVKVISSSDETHEFEYNERFKRYFPTNSNFAGEIGVKYRMEVLESEELVYSAEYDSIPPIVEFNVFFQDSSIYELSSNVIIEKRAIATLASLATIDEYFVKLDFRYSFFTNNVDVLEYEPDKFILNSHLDNVNNSEKLDLNVGFIIPCCFSVAETQVSLESMSKLAYSYWQSSQQLINNDGFIFDTFPFPLKGNISCENGENEVVGFFRTVSENQVNRKWNQ